MSEKKSFMWSSIKKHIVLQMPIYFVILFSVGLSVILKYVVIVAPQFVTLPLQAGSSMSFTESEMSNVVNSMSHRMVLWFRYMANSCYPIISQNIWLKPTHQDPNNDMFSINFFNVWWFILLSAHIDVTTVFYSSDWQWHVQLHLCTLKLGV